MALSSSECETMISAASDAGAVLAVGMDFRFIRAFQFVQQVLDQGLLGDIIRFDIRQGVVLNWALSSDYLLKKDKPVEECCLISAPTYSILCSGGSATTRG